MTDAQRKKLKKLLGKVCTFEGTKLKEQGQNFLIIDIKYKNKIITDHIWTPISKVNSHMEVGSTFIFKAIAYSYIDKKNQRKYGLHKVHDITLKHIETAQNDNNEKYKRLGYKRKKKL